MDKYTLIAKYYDEAYQAKKGLVDQDFYLETARGNGGPVLELGCGTGRILLPIARAGVEIWGVDLSPSMLSILQEKMSAEPEAVKAKARFIEDDIRSVDLQKTFPLVIIPFRALQHMYTVDDQIAALTSAKRHLAEDGLLVFDVFNPRFDLLTMGGGSEIREMAWPAGTNTEVVRFFKKGDLDSVRQVYNGSFIFRTYRDGKLISEEDTPFEMGYYTHPQLQLLFKITGLDVVESFGSFDKKPLRQGASEMIFLLKHVS